MYEPYWIYKQLNYKNIISLFYSFINKFSNYVFLKEILIYPQYNNIIKIFNLTDIHLKCNILKKIVENIMSW